MIYLTNTPSLLSDRLDTSSRSYFFDIREAKNGKKYLTIKESYSREGQRHEATISVWPEDATAFKDKLTQILTQLS